MIKLGLDTESLHLWFQNKRMDIFGFIEKAHELGFDGVMINILKDYNLDPEWGTLMSNDPAHLKKCGIFWKPIICTQSLPQKELRRNIS